MSSAHDAAPPSRDTALVSLLFHRAAEAVVVFDAQGRVLEASEGVATLAGEPVAELVGRGANELFEPHPSEGPIAAQVRAMGQDRARLRPWVAEVFVRGPGEGTIPATLSLSPIELPRPVEAGGTTDEGAGGLVLGVIRPWRDHEASARALIQADRLSTIGLLAGSAGHEIKNDLGPLVGCLDLLEARGMDDPMLALMRDAVRRIHDHVEQVLEPLRPRIKTRGAVFLRRAVDEVIVGMRRAGKLRRVSLKVDNLDGDDAVVHADRHEIEQLVLNLLSNADDALGDESGGNRGSIAVEVGIAGGHGLLLVRDDGPGMDPATRARAFSPRFTTKDHRGTGLGLPVVRLIVRELGGTVALKTAPREGTTVELRLPLFTR